MKTWLELGAPTSMPISFVGWMSIGHLSSFLLASAGAALSCESREAGLRRLAAQIHGKKVIVKHLHHTLHAKLYLLFRNDPVESDYRFSWKEQSNLCGPIKELSYGDVVHW